MAEKVERKERKPELRFKGFDGEWEKKILSEIMDEFIVPMRDKPKEFGGSIPWTRIEDIEGRCINGTLSNQYVTEETVVKMNLKIIPKNSLIVSASATFGVVAVVTRDLITNQTFIGLVPSSKYNLDYLYAFFHSHVAREYMKEKSAGSTIFYISQNDFKNMVALHPDLQEQTEIGEWFKDIDSCITNQQHKYNQLQNLKKAMLEKMFPREGADVPEIRFKGFEGAWNRELLNVYLTVSNEKNETETYTKEDVLSVSGEVGIVNQIKFQGRSFAGVSVSNYGVVHTGDIVYTKSPLSSNPFGIIKTNLGCTGIVSTLYAIYRPTEKVYPEFVQHYFEQNERLNNYLRPLVNKGAKNDMKVPNDRVLTGRVSFPGYAEQKRISEFFSSIDVLLNKSAIKIGKLQSFKSALLEKMFVSEADA